MLIAVAADKGAPGVTTTALALAAVWPRPVLLAECDPAGGDLVYRLPGEGGDRLDPRRGLLSLAVAARRDLQPAQLWTHAQKLRGGLDVLLGVTSAEQGAGLEPLWGPVGSLLAGLPQADVIADCGRLGPDGPYYDLLAHAAAVVLVTRPSLGEIVRLRDRAAAVSLARAPARRPRRPGRRAGRRRPPGLQPRARRGGPGARPRQHGQRAGRARVRAPECRAAARRVGRQARQVAADQDGPGGRRAAGRPAAAAPAPGRRQGPGRRAVRPGQRAAAARARRGRGARRQSPPPVRCGRSGAPAGAGRPGPAGSVPPATGAAGPGAAEPGGW